MGLDRAPEKQEGKVVLICVSNLSENKPELSDASLREVFRKYVGRIDVDKTIILRHPRFEKDVNSHQQLRVARPGRLRPDTHLAFRLGNHRQ